MMFMQGRGVNIVIGQGRSVLGANHDDDSMQTVEYAGMCIFIGQYEVS